jgi:RHS repeat-associated protein
MDMIIGLRRLISVLSLLVTPTTTFIFPLTSVAQLPSEECTLGLGESAIRTVNDLKAIKPRGKYVLCNNLEVGAIAPIGGKWKKQGFSGRFNGNGYALVRPTISNGTRRATGLFSLVRKGAEIVNLRIEEPSVTGRDNVGVIAGVLEGNIRNVVIQGPATIRGKENIGGFAGAVHEGTLELSTIQGDIYLYGDANIGGISGFNRKGRIDQVFADVTISGKDAIGLLIGRNSGKVSRGRALGSITVQGKKTRKNSLTNSKRLIGVNEKGGRISRSEVVTSTEAESVAIFDPRGGTNPTGISAGGIAGNFPLSGFDNVNLYNGQLGVKIPLLTIGGRGEAGYTMMLPFRRYPWVIIKGHHLGKSLEEEAPTIAGPTLAEPSSTEEDFYGPGYLDIRTTEKYLGRWRFSLTRIAFLTPDGGEVELVDEITRGQPLRVQKGSSSRPFRGSVFVSTDGSNLRFVAAAPLDDTPYKKTDTLFEQRLTGKLYFPNGMVYDFRNSLVERITDRHGNEVRITTEKKVPMVINGREERVTRKTITDLLGRQVVAVWNPTSPTNLQTVSYTGFQGRPRTMSVLVAESESKDIKDSLFRDGYWKQRYEGKDVASQDYLPRTVKRKLVKGLTLPDGRQYSFHYNDYFELSGITLPTGGGYEYIWGSGTTDPAIGDSQGLLKQALILSRSGVYRRVLQKNILNNGQREGEIVFQTEEDRVGNQSSVTVEYRDVRSENIGPTVLKRERSIFFGVPSRTLADNWVDDCQNLSETVCDQRASRLYYNGWKEGTSRRTESFDIATGALLSSIDTVSELRPKDSREQSLYWLNLFSDAPEREPQRDVRVIETLSAVEGLATKKTVNSYDEYNNTTETVEYDLTVSSSVPVRKTVSSFVKSNTIYSSLPGGNGSFSYTQDEGRRLLRLVKETKLFGYTAQGAEYLASHLVNEFDNYSSDSRHAPLVERPDASGLNRLPSQDGCSAGVCHASQLMRGNITDSKTWDDARGEFLTTSIHYDELGNAVTVIDARGNRAFYKFTDNFGAPDGNARNGSAVGANTYAFATETSNALGHTDHVQFDYSIGKPVDTENENGTVNSAWFDDVLDRPTRVSFANGRFLSTATYRDSELRIDIRNDLIRSGDQLNLSSQRFDQLGRIVEESQIGADGTTLTSRSEFDALGRTVGTSSKHLQGSRELFSRTVYDSLGRQKEVTLPDGQRISTAYTGLVTRSFDPRGKETETTMDGVGRVISVREAPNESSLNYVTTYRYDAKDRMVEVNQGGGVQRRFFKYSSTGALIRTRIPEKNANSTLALGTVDPVTGQNQWDSKMQYDEGGNLIERTDAMGRVIRKRYDSLNRVVSISYSDSTPEVVLEYDRAVGGKGRVYSVSTLANDGVRKVIPGYDPIGYPLALEMYFFRPGVVAQSMTLSSEVKTSEMRRGPIGVWGAPYRSDYEYDVSGKVTKMTYPSGRSVRYDHDGLTRLRSIAGNLGGTERGYLRNYQYNDLNKLSQVTLGTDLALYAKQRFNDREQLTKFLLSSVSGDESGDYGSFSLTYEKEISTGQGLQRVNSGVIWRTEQQVPVSPGSPSLQNVVFDVDYDGTDRLKWVKAQAIAPNSSVGALFQQFFSYDAFGNRRVDASVTSGGGFLSRENRAIDVNTNRFQQVAGQIEYDHEGNLIRDGDQIRRFDVENRLKEVQNSVGVSRFSYDEGSSRTRKQTPQEHTWFVYGLDGQLLAEYSAEGAPSTPVREYGWNADSLIVIADQGKVQWVISDHLGTPRMIVGQSGRRDDIEYRVILPFGEQFPIPGFATQPDYKLRRTFTSYERDKETNLDYASARFYSSTSGRFISADPLLGSGRPQDPQSWNRYSYVLNRVLSAVDPSGTEDIVIIVTRNDKNSSDTSHPSAELRIFDPKGNVVSIGGKNGPYSIEGLARGTSRNRTQTEGDTPYGVYNVMGLRGGYGSYRWSGFAGQASTRSYGTGIIHINGVQTRDSSVYEAWRTNRAGLAIHGGGNSRRISNPFEDNQPLINTYGCIRLPNEKMNDLLATARQLAWESPERGIHRVIIGDRAYLNNLAKDKVNYPGLAEALGTNYKKVSLDVSSRFQWGEDQPSTYFITNNAATALKFASIANMGAAVGRMFGANVKK